MVSKESLESTVQRYEQDEKREPAGRAGALSAVDRFIILISSSQDQLAGLSIGLPSVAIFVQ